VFVRPVANQYHSRLHHYRIAMPVLFCLGCSHGRRVDASARRFSVLARAAIAKEFSGRNKKDGAPAQPARP
jgi:hypothetical protein